MLETLLILTPLLMLISYEIGKLNGQKALKSGKTATSAFFNNKLIEVEK